MSSDETEDAIDILQTSTEEARQTLDHQIQALDDINTKAIQILRVNLVLISIILTVFSLSSNSEVLSISDFINVYTASGVICLLGSTAFAALAYSGSDMKPGIHAQVLRDIIKEDYDPQTYYEELVVGYANWIEFNEEQNKRSMLPITLTNLLIIWAVVLLSLGVTKAIIGRISFVLLASVIVALLLVTYLTGIVRYARRWISTIELG